jgi:hypothetical protein
VLEDAQSLADELTEILKVEHGTMSLRPLQAVALYELGTENGLFAPMRVGAGKTLISLLAPVVTFSLRPILLVPASLVTKTERDLSVLRNHWGLPRFLRIVSYERLGRISGADILDQYQPDLLIADEAHRLKNLRAAVTRRVKRYLEEHRPKTAVMSGTITKRSLKDYSHLTQWALWDNAPLPRGFTETELWADALDERKRQRRRANPGALIELCNEEEKSIWLGDPRRAARHAFRRRLVETPGVVASYETPIDASILVQGTQPPVPSTLDAAFSKLRSTWETPDGWPISDGLAMFRHARELALGFYYIWDPRPPEDWLNARRVWASFVRQVIKRSNTLDSELQVRNAFADTDECQAWLAIRDSFKPHTRPVWVTDLIALWCAKWLVNNNGIVWTEHKCFGRRVAKLAHRHYYGAKGQNAEGRPIESQRTDRGMVASIQSNSLGRNLQAWCKNLITSMPANGMQTEQLMGRTHRDGQLADGVGFDVLLTCAEHVGAFWQAHRDSLYVNESTGAPQKLLLADITKMPNADDIAWRSDARWAKEW